MSVMFWKSMNNVYALFCILTTLMLIIWCCYEYGKDEDVCEVLFKELGLYQYMDDFKGFFTSKDGKV